MHFGIPPCIATACRWIGSSSSTSDSKVRGGGGGGAAGCEGPAVACRDSFLRQPNILASGVVWLSVNLVLEVRLLPFLSLTLLSAFDLLDTLETA